MDTTTFVWTLAATFLAGIQVFVGKIVAHEKRDSAFNGIFTYGVAAVAALVILLVTRNWPQQWLAIALFGGVSGAVHAFGNFYRIESLKFIDSVIYFPINKILGPVLVVISGILIFGDVLTLRQFIGIGLSLTVPILLVSSSERDRQNDLKKGVILLVVSTVITVIALLFSKKSVSYGATDVVFALLMTQTAGVLVSSAIFWFKNKHGGLLDSISKRDLSLGFAAGFLGFLSYFTLLTALSMGYISLVYVIHAHYILIPIILAVWMHKDHINTRKLIAIVVSSLAIILLYKA